MSAAFFIVFGKAKKLFAAASDGNWNELLPDKKLCFLSIEGLPGYHNFAIATDDK